MILDLRTLKRSGRDEMDFCFEYVSEELTVNIPNVEIDFPVMVTGTVSLTGDHSAYVEGEISFSISGECTRCLKPASEQLFIEFGEQVEKDSEYGYQVINDKIDLTTIVDEAIAINLPLSLLCKSDCKGICMNCGVNLNDEQCKCEK